MIVSECLFVNGPAKTGTNYTFPEKGIFWSLCMINNFCKLHIILNNEFLNKL